jgi:uncharacterized protein YjiS (DUF1127 family)
MPAMGAGDKRILTMAYAANNPVFSRPFGLDFSGLAKAIADWRVYQRTVSELDAMSDRDLADLGVSRLSIRDIAREAAYGA